MSERPKIAALPGDGIGPEIMAAARRLLDAIGEFEVEELLVGGASIDEHGTALTPEVLDACRRSDAVLLAAVGGPKWDTTDPDAPRPEQGLLGLRKGLGLYAGSLPPVPPSGVDVREVDVIVNGRPPKDPAPPPGFTEVSRASTPSYLVVRYQAPAPRHFAGIALLQKGPTQ